MKVERAEVIPVFEPITITIENDEELKWLIAIANTAVSVAVRQAEDLGFEISRNTPAQMSLWNGISKYMELCND